ncbi:molybdopterin-dependent oxidoreductase [Nocardia sp. NPDC052254]|uniref:molybdopterin-dependent oxidoreductase n=1 Tax=Nocardia sp. NPDC052254 TaxID=3155681 RepID=UPI003447CE8B
MAGTGLRAACGLVSAGLALGVAELVSVPVGAGSAPLSALGSTMVDHTPDGVREWAIDTFGTNDKSVLYLLMGVAALIVAACVGALERTARPVGSVVLGLFGIAAAWAAVERPAADWTWALPSVIGVAFAIVMLRWLIRRCDVAVSGGSPAQGSSPPKSAESVAAQVDRRQVVRGIAGVGVLAVAAGIAGRMLGASVRSVAAERAAVRLPTPPVPEAPVVPGADLRIPGLAPYLTPASDFYRIDTALTVPQVSTDGWSLRIHGMVDREIRLDYADLARRRPVERMVTLTCVSNPIGGDLIGNARWLGYRLDELIAEARPHPDADMVLSRSADGFTAGSPLAALTDGRDALLAVGMNGEPLPVEHGYPARLVVPGLYGYVSATKWVTELEITRFDRAQAYWTRRGWSARGPIKTGTRIDTPRGTVRAGAVTIAGVAWAQHRGIRAVEVQIDNGPWQSAHLADEPSIDTWRQWSFDWDAASGTHTIRARSTDGTGEVQTAEVADVIPDGASGYPSRTVRVG